MKTAITHEGITYTAEVEQDGKVTIGRNRVLAGVGRWNGSRIDDCPAVLDEAVYAKLDAALLAQQELIAESAKPPGGTTYLLTVEHEGDSGFRPSGPTLEETVEQARYHIAEGDWSLEPDETLTVNFWLTSPSGERTQHEVEIRN